MNLDRNKKLAKALMILGLSLLLLGLSLWIYAEYERNKSILKDKMDLVFTNTVHDVDLELVDDLLTSVMNIDLQYNTNIDSLSSHFKQDSISIELETDSLLFEQSHRIAYIGDGGQTGSTIKMIMKKDGFSFKNFGSEMYKDSIDLFVLIQEKLPKHINNDFKNVFINLSETTLDTSFSENQFTTWKFNEENSNKSYFLSIDNYRNYLLNWRVSNAPK